MPPVVAVDGGWRITLDAEERGLLVRLAGELRALLTDADDDNPLVQRLFPTAYPDDADREAEYQRLMREELVTSRLAALDTVTEVLDPRRAEQPGDDLLDEGQTIAFMQSVNAVRLVLGTMLGVTDDDDADDVERADTPEQQLYDFLSWLLEWTVQSLSPD